MRRALPLLCVLRHGPAKGSLLTTGYRHTTSMTVVFMQMPVLLIMLLSQQCCSGSITSDRATAAFMLMVRIS